MCPPGQESWIWVLQLSCKYSWVCSQWSWYLAASLATQRSWFPLFFFVYWLLGCFWVVCMLDFPFSHISSCIYFWVLLVSCRMESEFLWLLRGVTVCVACLYASCILRCICSTWLSTSSGMFSLVWIVCVLQMFLNRFQLVYFICLFLRFVEVSSMVSLTGRWLDERVSRVVMTCG
mgnify:CR=1 FL=1